MKHFFCIALIALMVALCLADTEVIFEDPHQFQRQEHEQFVDISDEDISGRTYPHHGGGGYGGGHHGGGGGGGGGGYGGVAFGSNVFNLGRAKGYGHQPHHKSPHH